MSAQSRGIRNNNPGNIDYVPANKWRGQLPPNPVIEKRFARFDTPENGIRALAKLLLTYQAKHGLKTVAQVIGRWAPATENNTKAYAEAVSKAMGVTSYANIDLRSPAMLTPMVTAIIQHENGYNPYIKGEITEGVRMALE